MLVPAPRVTINGLEPLNIFQCLKEMHVRSVLGEKIFFCRFCLGVMRWTVLTLKRRISADKFFLLLTHVLFYVGT